MDFDLGAELEAFRDEVRAFFRDEMDPTRTAPHRDAADLTGFDEGFERALLRSRVCLGGMAQSSCQQCAGAAVGPPGGVKAAARC